MPEIDHSRVLKGKIVSFDTTTWWGEVQYDLTILQFHGTCFRGMTAHYMPKVGDKVNIVLNSAGRLLSVEGRK